MFTSSGEDRAQRRRVVLRHVQARLAVARARQATMLRTAVLLRAGGYGRRR